MSALAAGSLKLRRGGAACTHKERCSDGSRVSRCSLGGVGLAAGGCVEVLRNAAGRMQPLGAGLTDNVDQRPQLAGVAASRHQATGTGGWNPVRSFRCADTSRAE
jgi:hypothetical protein